MKLGLGTVQFGLAYGISNQAGKTLFSEVGKIIRFAEEIGISVLDTAADYGESEQVLGKYLPRDHAFRIVSKVSKTDQFKQSLSHLGVSSIDSCLIRAKELLTSDSDQLMRALQLFKAEGSVKKIGLSAYTRDEIDAVIGRYPIDLLQLPINIFDQRLLEDHYLDKLKADGLEIHARSVFLQGLLLMDLGDIPSYFSAIKPKIKTYQQWLSDSGLSALRAALGFALNIDAVDTWIVGVNNVDQLRAIHQEAKAIKDVDFSAFAINDDRYVNPARWLL